MKFIQENLIEFLKQSIYLILKTYKFFFFYLFNNLLHGARWQTVVATFVTTYKGSTLTWKRERKTRERKRGREKGI